ncbi:PilZ domain-containing protein [Fimbriimonadia bacterium ATM]|nr:PilZ domain-containing protein [Armatimonadota bacterium]MCE7900367.1 PilZ domain-containing protein [Armatimonadetes bacterium ATM1]MDL1928521.1 PilZ domain-containing protein [Fimbriimonadia bacterium ATM]
MTLPNDPSSLLVWFLALFAASALFGCCVAAVRSASHRPSLLPQQNSKVALKHGGTTYECEWVEASRRGWIARNLRSTSEIPPVSAAKSLLASFPTPKGLAVFWTKVLAVHREPMNLVVLAPPSRISLRERRTHDRVELDTSPRVRIDDAPCRAHDISRGGLAASSPIAFQPGSDVLVQTPDGRTVEGWVLDCRAQEPGMHKVRVRWVRELALDDLWEIKTALVG